MSIIEKLQEESNSINAVKNEVISEITTAFSNYIDNDFESFLEKNIDYEAKKKREYDLCYGFLEHFPDGEPTRFYIAGWEWKNTSVPDYSNDQNFYKGIRLWDIQGDVIEQLLQILKSYLDKEGFNYWFFTARATKNHFNYPEHIVSIYW